MFLMFHLWEVLEKDKCCCFWEVHMQVTMPPGGQACSAEASTLPSLQCFSLWAMWWWLCSHKILPATFLTHSPRERSSSNTWQNTRAFASRRRPLAFATSVQPGFPVWMFATATPFHSLRRTVRDSSEAVSHRVAYRISYMTQIQINTFLSFPVFLWFFPPRKQCL